MRNKVRIVVEYLALFDLHDAQQDVNGVLLGPVFFENALFEPERGKCRARLVLDCNERIVIGLSVGHGVDDATIFSPVAKHLGLADFED